MNNYQPTNTHSYKFNYSVATNTRNFNLMPKRGVSLYDLKALSDHTSTKAIVNHRQVMLNPTNRRSYSKIAPTKLPASPVWAHIQKDINACIKSPPLNESNEHKFKPSETPIGKVTGRVAATSVAHYPNTAFINCFNKGTLVNRTDMTTNGMSANARRILIKWSAIDQLANQTQEILKENLPDANACMRNTISNIFSSLIAGIGLAPIERIRSIQATKKNIKLSDMDAMRIMLKKGGWASTIRGWQMNAFDSYLLLVTPTEDWKTGLLTSLMLSPVRTLSYSMRFKQQVDGITLQEAAKATLRDIRADKRIFLINGIGHSLLHGPIYQGVLCATLNGLDEDMKDIEIAFEKLSSVDLEIGIKAYQKLLLEDGH